MKDAGRDRAPSEWKIDHGIDGGINVAIQQPMFQIRLIGHRYYLPLCFAFYVALRALLIAFVSIDQGSDSAWYLGRASAIAEGLGYSENNAPTTYWPVGWPAALGLVFWMFEASSMVGQLFNLALSCISFVLLLKIARLSFDSENTARIAVSLLTIYPNNVAYVHALMSEVFFTTMLLLVCYLFLEWQRQGFRWGFVMLICGVSSGVMTLTKPQFVFFPSLILLLCLILSQTKVFKKTIIINALIVNALMLATIAPWTYRNYQTFGTFVFISANGGMNLLIGNNPEATGGYMSLPASSYPTLQFSPERMLVVDRQASAIAAQWIKDNPLAVVRLLPRKVWKLWGIDGEIEWVYQLGGRAYEDHVLLFRSLRVLNQVYYAAAITVGFGVFPWLLYRRRTRVTLPMLLGLVIAAYTTTISLAVFGLPRFHFPVMPFVMIYCAVVACELLGEAPSGIAQTSAPP